ncbi:MAG: ACT domain-containing protein [Rhizobiaceae bacterium]
MATQLILTFLADDRPGLVDTLSQAVTEAGGNWLESRTATMAGKFAGIIHVELPDTRRAEALRARLASLRSLGLQVTVDDAPSGAAAAGPGLVIELIGPDHPGIVRDIAHCLAVHRVNIETMETNTSDTPMGGGMLFHARISVSGPADLDEDGLRGELEQLAGALMVDLSLREPDGQ